MVREPVRVAVLVERDTPVAEGILRGVWKSAGPLRAWALRVEGPSVERMELVRAWRPAGVIGQLNSMVVADAVTALGVPCVNVGNKLETPGVASVVFDDRAVGRMAARHFMEKGFERFAFLGSVRRARGRDRLAGFREELGLKGYDVATLGAEHAAKLEARANIWSNPDEAVVRFLEGLKKPVAVLNDNDRLARVHSEVCRLRGIAVPEEVAMLGVSDDELECGLADPPLSSIRLPSEEVGRRAVGVLAGLMGESRGAAHGETPWAFGTGESHGYRLAPLGVVERASTDVVAVRDAGVAAALRVIRENAHRPVNVETVLRAVWEGTGVSGGVGDGTLKAGGVRVSRRGLEQKFKRVLGRTPLQEIHRVRIVRACELLSGTAMPIAEVAVACGFAEAPRLSERFKAVMGVTPAAWRRRAMEARGLGGGGAGAGGVGAAGGGVQGGLSMAGYADGRGEGASDG
ncbi:MAG: substrate-binding domain-containing protein [Planctomycetota bacterium]